jgi:membrane protein implicated in regulation of membrane protease activity
MAFQPVYWHWLVFGMLLIIAELFIPSFTVLWFGLAGVAVSVLILITPDLSLTWQLFVWAIASCLMTFLWFFLFKPRMIDRTHAGIAREAIVGQTGQVIKTPVDGRDGMVRFAVPLLGADEWAFFCSDMVVQGDRVRVREISGNTLIVEKTSSS